MIFILWYTTRVFTLCPCSTVTLLPTLNQPVATNPEVGLLPPAGQSPRLGEHEGDVGDAAA